MGWKLNKETGKMEQHVTPPSNKAENVTIAPPKPSQPATVEFDPIAHARANYTPAEDTETSSSDLGAEQSAQDKYDEIESSLCEGDMELVIADFGAKARTNINILGLGSILSGKYYISGISLSVSRDNVNQSFKLRKTEFGGVIREPNDVFDGRPSPLVK